jgi:hypothetical protein
MRLKRGTLAGRKVEGRWVVLVPRANDDPTGTEREESFPETATQRLTQRFGEHTNAVHDLIDALRSENAFLRDELGGRTEEIRRRDHIIAGLVERVQALPAGEPSQDAPQDAPRAPTAHERREAFWHTPAQAPTTLRAVLRRLIGH